MAETKLPCLLQALDSASSGSAKQLARLREALACLGEAAAQGPTASCLVPVARWQQTAQLLKQPPFDVSIRL